MIPLLDNYNPLLVYNSIDKYRLKEMENKIYDIRKVNKMRCIAGLVMGFIMIALTFTALILNVANFYDENAPEAGMGTLRMFTTLSNLLVGSGALLTIPFQIDGLRKNNYHLPNWIVDALYTGTLCVSLTFVVAISAISIAEGFIVAMFSKSNLFLHTINPICAIILFTFVNTDHNVKFYKSFLSLSPIFLYAILYFILAIVIGDENGGWRDVYGFNKYVPWPVSLIIIFIMAFGLSNLLRYLHNLKHKHTKNSIINYYKESDDYKFGTIEEAVAKLATNNKKYYVGGDIEVPTRIIEIFKERYNSDIKMEELVNIYTNTFIINN